jgi:hypothetical protein
MKLAWYPENLNAPAALTSVVVPLGKLEEKAWLQALADRVVEMALQEEDPLEASRLACLKLGLPSVDSPQQLGAALVQHNLELRTFLNLSEVEDQWPAQVKRPLEGAKSSLKDVNLDTWVELASSQVSGSDLD